MLNVRFSLLYCLIFSISFIACTGDGADSSTQEVSFKHNDNTVRFRLPRDANNLNPAIIRGYDQYYLAYMFQFLLEFDTETLDMAPQLAKSKPAISDKEGSTSGPSYTFEILEEATWDDGTPVTGHDYEWSLKAIFNPKLPSDHIRAFLDPVKNVVVDETNPKIFTVHTRYKYILSEAAIGNIFVMPKHIYDPNGVMDNFELEDLTDPEKSAQLAEADERLQQFVDEFTSPKYTRETISGSGPYKFVEWEDKQRMVLAKKENWWGESLAASNKLLEAYPDTIVFMPIRDDNALGTAIRDENIDVAISINSKVFKDLEQDSRMQEVYNFQTPGTYNVFYSGLNTKSDKLSDKRVRRALAMLVDLDKVIEVIYQGYGDRISVPFPSDAPYYRKDLPLIQEDIEGAKSLLKEAGWEDTDGDGIVDKEIDGVKTPLSLSYMNGGSQFSKDYYQIWSDNAKKAGIDLQSQELSLRVMIGEKLPSRDFDIFGLQAAADPLAVMDPRQLWHTDSDTPSGGNRSGFGTPESDALIDEIRATLDTEKRHQMYRELQEMIYEEQPWIILFSPQERIVIHKRFEGNASKLRPGIHVNHLKLKQ